MGERLTQGDIDKIKKEIEYRTLVVRKEAIEAVSEARAQGDLSENFEYYAAKREKNRNESRIRFLERMIKTAQIIPDDSKADEIGMNNTVEVMFEEDGAYYTSHLWITGMDDVAFECSFTVSKGSSAAEAEAVIASLEKRKEGVKYPAEIIPVRLSEIYQINEAFEWVTTTVKEQLKKDFQGMEEDLDSMQQVIDSGTIGPKKKEAWLSFGIVICVILANEVDGLEWMTLIDGNREAPVLQNLTTGEWIDPMKLVWSKVKAGEPCNLAETYKALL